MLDIQRKRFLLHILFFLTLGTMQVSAGIGTTVPVSRELASSVAGNLFPVTVKLNRGNLFLTNPVVLFLDDKRVGMQLRLQAYDHRPEENILFSETGSVFISGELDYDSATKEFLLHNPRVDKLEFDRANDTVSRLENEINAAWTTHVQNPMRSEFPPHPYLLPFKDNVKSVAYDGSNINLEIFYQ